MTLSAINVPGGTRRKILEQSEYVCVCVCVCVCITYLVYILTYLEEHVGKFWKSRNTYVFACVCVCVYYVPGKYINVPGGTRR